MASRSFHALFLRARDAYAASGRWLYLAVLALAALHAGIVTPAIEGSRLESEATSERKRLAAVESGLEELGSSLAAVRDEITSAFTPALERLAEDLEHDLARLEATRRKHAADRQALETAADAEGDGEPRPSPAEAKGERGPVPFLLDDPDRIADLRDAGNRDELLAALAPLAEELIAQPRYFDLEHSFRDEVLPRLEARIDAAAGTVPRLRGRFPEARAGLDSLAGALSFLTRNLRELRLRPPAAPFWWTVPAAGDDVELGLTAAVAARIREPRELRDLEAAAGETLERFDEVAGELRRMKRELGERPGAGLLRGLDLQAFVPTFPLLVGLALGGAVAWRSGRLRELGLVTLLEIEQGGPAALRRWLWSLVQWRSAAGRSAASAWRSCVLQTLLGYFIAMGWITLAAIQLRQLETVDRLRLMVFTIAGAAAVLFAVVQRLAVARRAILTLDFETRNATEVADGAGGGLVVGADGADGGLVVGADGGTSGIEGGRDAELIDVQTLRR